MRIAGKLALVALISLGMATTTLGATGEGKQVKPPTPTTDWSTGFGGGRTYVGWVHSGIDSDGDLFVAIDQADSPNGGDELVDLLFVLQGPRVRDASQLIRDPFFGVATSWGNRLEIAGWDDSVVARFMVPAPEPVSQTEEWWREARSATNIEVVGIVENHPAPKFSTNIRAFAARATVSDAQVALVPPEIQPEIPSPWYPDPGDGGGGGGSSCDNGGPGASSCSTGYGGDGCSVTCQAGYYACCQRGGFMISSHCYCVHN